MQIIDFKIFPLSIAIIRELKNGFSKMRRIRQGDTTGCGLACIAMLAKTSYKEVRKAAVDELDYERKGQFYTDTKELRELADFFDIELGLKKRKFKSFESLSKLYDLAILAINYKEKSKTWHWVLYCHTGSEEYVYDPNTKSNKRRDLTRIEKNTRWFLPVYST